MNAFVALMYHNLTPEHARSYEVTVPSFTAQVAWLAAEGYVMEGFDGLRKRLVSNQWPERYAVLTFDDGHRSNLQAAEILNKAGGRATFFITQKFCRSRADFMTDAEIRALHGLSQVGSHSISHPDMTRLSADEARHELTDSRKWLEDVTGEVIDTFSAPNGSVNPNVVQLALAAGYTLVGNSREWWNVPSDVAESHVVNRFAIRHSFDVARFKTIVERNTLFYWKRQIRSSILAIPKALVPSARISNLVNRRGRK